MQIHTIPCHVYNKNMFVMTSKEHKLNVQTSTRLCCLCSVRSSRSARAPICTAAVSCWSGQRWRRTWTTSGNGRPRTSTTQVAPRCLPLCSSRVSVNCTQQPELTWQFILLPVSHECALLIHLYLTGSFTQTYIRWSLVTVLLRLCFGKMCHLRNTIHFDQLLRF